MTKIIMLNFLLLCTFIKEKISVLHESQNMGGKRNKVAIHLSAESLESKIKQTTFYYDFNLRCVILLAMSYSTFFQPHFTSTFQLMCKETPNISQKRINISSVFATVC